METVGSGYVFFECRNSLCGLRFPLDATRFEGRYCPRCGTPLERNEAGVPPKKPPSSPKPAFQLIGALDNIRSTYNVGAIFRAADGTGVAELLLGGITPSPVEQPAISKTALGAEKSVPWHSCPNLPATLLALKAEGAMILALEFVPGARALEDFQFDHPLPEQVILVSGSEPAGVDPAILRLADQVLYIPMSGQKSSLNVSVAFGIAPYHLSGLTLK